MEEIFDEIYGYEDVKRLFHSSIEKGAPQNILLCSPPASGKTLLLKALSKLPDSKYCLGGLITKAGLMEVLTREKPKYLIIDELDNCKIYDVLLSLKDIKIYGACTNTDRIPPELLNRFLIVHL
jgi:Holliday junction DNA helicase RuvB